MPVCVLFGYGLGAADAILDGFLAAGFSVAIVGRTLSKLQAAAGKKAAGKVFPIACDLAKPEQVPGVIAQVHFDTILSCIRRHSRHDIHVNHCYNINATMHECVAYQLPDRQTQVQKDVGAIDVVIYNATTASFPSYDDVPLQSIIDAAMVNQASLWTAYYAVLPAFKAAGKGAFLATGGGLEANGAYGVGFGFQLGSPTKAYFRNFCEAMHATHSSLGIRVINMKVSSLLYGGDNVTMPDPNPAKSANFRVKLGKAYVDAATGACPANPDILVNDDGC